jgi:hypothetical protein
MRTEPRQVAARLGLAETTIDRLQARGLLSRLAVTEREIRERLYRAHVAHVLTRSSGEGGGGERSVRFIRWPLCVLVALLAITTPHSASADTSGWTRVLVVLATSGPRPYTVAEVDRTMRAADRYLRTASLGRVRLKIDVTPWLAAFDADPGCGGLTQDRFSALVAPAKALAARAGYDVSRYGEVIYAIAASHCGFDGEAWDHEVMLTRRPSLRLVVHELGHTLGLAHAQASDCPFAARCGVDETGDPLSPMGSGMLDFSAYEKATLGWIPHPPHVHTARLYGLAVPTIRTTFPQTLVVETKAGRCWIEYRSRPFRGLVVRFVDRTQTALPFATPSVLIRNPTKGGRPWVAPGESYRIPGSFRATLLRAGTTQAQVRFRHP